MSAAEKDEWETRYLASGVRLADPEPFIVCAVSQLGAAGVAVDLAGGTGRHALWLAAQGWTTTLADIAPTALEIASMQAAAAALTLHTLQGDLDDGLPVTAPADLVVIHHYLNRPLLANVATLLTPGGHLVMAHPTITNLERNDRPSRRYLLDPAELPTLLAGLEVESYFEGWTELGRHEAQVVARRPPVAEAGAAT